jgi:carboxypeptidase Q
VSVPDADVMAAHAARGQVLRMHLHMDNRSDVPAVTHNVIADLPGTDWAHEVVLIGAHLDSWDLGQGAVDDGAGVAIVSAAAGLMAQAGLWPRRTIRVVLFANEENGFDGAMAYGKAYAQVPHQLVAESDFGGGRIYRLASRVQVGALPLIAQMAEVLRPLGVEPGDNQGNPGPDAAFLMRSNRWPGLALSQDGTRYFDVHHTERDTIDQLDPADLQQNTACWAATAWLAAQAPLSFAPVPLPEVRR